MRPIHVYQCKQDCCIVRIPSKRFWYCRTPKGRETFSSFGSAIQFATYMAPLVVQEVTA